MESVHFDENGNRCDYVSAEKKKNEELDETIVQTCKWIQRKLQISDKSIKDEKVPEMMSALAALVAAREETLNKSMIF